MATSLKGWKRRLEFQPDLRLHVKAWCVSTRSMRSGIFKDPQWNFVATPRPDTYIPPYFLDSLRNIFNIQKKKPSDSLNWYLVRNSPCFML